MTRTRFCALIGRGSARYARRALCRGPTMPVWVPGTPTGIQAHFCALISHFGHEARASRCGSRVARRQPFSGRCQAPNDDPDTLLRGNRAPSGTNDAGSRVAGRQPFSGRCLAPNDDRDTLLRAFSVGSGPERARVVAGWHPRRGSADALGLQRVRVRQALGAVVSCISPPPMSRIWPGMAVHGTDWCSSRSVSSMPASSSAVTISPRPWFHSCVTFFVNTSSVST